MEIEMISDALSDAIQRINNLLDGPMYHRAAFEDDGLLSEIREVVVHMNQVRNKLDAPPVCPIESEPQH